MRPLLRPLSLVLAGLMLGACEPRPIAEKPGNPPTPAGTVSPAITAAVFAPLNEPSLHNGHRVTKNVMSGAQPEGRESFEALQRLGVKTILSVDGAAPDIATAKEFGMRYVHLPIEYSGVSPEQGQAIAKAITELPGPVYIHCHHGKHRSAAAVAVACVYNGSLDPNEAEWVLKTFGTGNNYTGLWKSAREARPVPPETLKSLRVDFVETAKVPELVAGMTRIDYRHENLKLAQKAGWTVPKDHPDIDPPHEALQLEELLHETARTGETADYPDDFRKRMEHNESAVKALRQALLARPFDKSAADLAMKNVGASCLSCHQQYRDQ